MQHMIRWQVEAVKSEITGAVFGFRIVSLRWQRKNEVLVWEKLIPDEVEREYTLYSGSLDDLYQDEYIKLLKINFISAFRAMNWIAHDFAGNKLSHNKFGLNWIEYTWEDNDELDRRTCDEDRVSGDSEITRHC